MFLNQIVEFIQLHKLIIIISYFIILAYFIILKLCSHFLKLEIKHKVKKSIGFLILFYLFSLGHDLLKQNIHFKELLFLFLVLVIMNILYICYIFIKKTYLVLAVKFSEFRERLKSKKVKVPEKPPARTGYPAQMLTTFGLKVRSKSEVFIAEKLFSEQFDFEYETPLSAGGKTFYPDFTIKIGKQIFYWEHFGLLSDAAYYEKTKIKIKWYNKFFQNKLICTEESNTLLLNIEKEIEKLNKIRQRQCPDQRHHHPGAKQSHDSKEYAFRTHQT